MDHQDHSSAVSPLSSEEEVVELWNVAMETIFSLRGQVARLEAANDATGKDVAGQLRHLARFLEQVVLPEPVPSCRDAFIEWLRIQNERQDAIGALARFAREEGVSTLSDLQHEISLDGFGRRGDPAYDMAAEDRVVSDALDEFCVAFMRARAQVAPKRPYSVQLPGGDRIEILMDGHDFGVFSEELERRQYQGRELSIHDQAGRIKAWVTAEGWRVKAR